MKIKIENRVQHNFKEEMNDLQTAIRACFEGMPVKIRVIIENV